MNPTIKKYLFLKDLTPEAKLGSLWHVGENGFFWESQVILTGGAYDLVLHTNSLYETLKVKNLRLLEWLKKSIADLDPTAAVSLVDQLQIKFKIETLIMEKEKT